MIFEFELNNGSLLIAGILVADNIDILTTKITEAIEQSQRKNCLTKKKDEEIIPETKAVLEEK